MRDTVKSAAYYQKYLESENQLIEAKAAKLQTVTDAAAQQRILLNLCRSRLNVLLASFSAGASEKELNELLGLLVDDCVKRQTITYSTLLSIAGFCVLLNNKNCAQKALQKFQHAYDDVIITAFLQFAAGGSARWQPERLAFAEDFSMLLDAAKAPADEKEKALCAYLEFWSKKNDKLLKAAESDDANFTGFWCFEAAAMARIFRLNTAHFRSYSYFPVI